MQDHNTFQCIAPNSRCSPRRRPPNLSGRAREVTEFTDCAAGVDALAIAAIGLAGTAVAAAGFPSYGNARDTVNALPAQGYNVQLNGAAVHPLSGYTADGIEGLNNSNTNSAGGLIDRTRATTVNVDISCKGG
jgi:hypothetical protein